MYFSLISFVCSFLNSYYILDLYTEDKIMNKIDNCSSHPNREPRKINKYMSQQVICVGWKCNLCFQFGDSAEYTDVYQALHVRSEARFQNSVTEPPGIALANAVLQAGSLVYAQLEQVLLGRNVFQKTEIWDDSEHLIFRNLVSEYGCMLTV